MKTSKVKTIVVKYSFTILLALSFISNLKGQELSEVFNDGGLRERKNILKVNFIPLFQGELPVYYERVLTKNLSFEVGLGLQLPYYLPDIGMLGDGPLGSEHPSFRVQWWLFPKYYFKEAPEMGFVGVILRQRNYHVEEGDYKVTDIIYSYGLQFFLSDNVMMEMNLGIGYRSLKNLTTNTKEPGFTAGYGLKLGYIF